MSKEVLTRQFVESIEKLKVVSPFSFQHSLSWTFRFDSDSIFMALSSAMLLAVKELPEWKEYTDKQSARTIKTPYYHKNTSTPQFKFEWNGLIVGYSARWTGAKGDLESKRLMWIKSKKLGDGYKKLPDKLVIRIYPDWDNDRGISINVHIARAGTTFQVYPMAKALENDISLTKKAFIEFISHLKIGSHDIDLSRMEQYVSYTETYVRINREKTPQLMKAIDSFFYTLSCLSSSSLEVNSNILRHYNRDKFNSLFRGGFSMSEFGELLGCDIGNIASLKVYFPESFRSSRKTELGYHPKVECKITTTNKTDGERAREFYQCFLTFFLLCAGIKSSDFIVQDRGYFGDDRAIEFDMLSDVFTGDKNNGHFNDYRDYEAHLGHLLLCGLVEKLPDGIYQKASSISGFLEFFQRDMGSDFRVSHFSYDLPDFNFDAEFFKELRRKQDILNDLEKMGLKKSDKYESIKSEIRALNESLRKIGSLFFSPVRLEMLQILGSAKCCDYYSLMGDLSLARTTVNYHTNMLFKFGLIEKGELVEAFESEGGDKYGSRRRVFSISPSYSYYLNDLGYYDYAPKIVEVIKKLFFIYQKHQPELLPFTNDELRWWEHEMTADEIVLKIKKHEIAIGNLNVLLRERMDNG